MLTKGRHHLRGPRWPNVWEFARVPFGRSRHPAEKPVPLLQRAIESSSDRDALVVDPFCGSGSTAEAAIRSGRRALIGDVDRRWLRECLDRLSLSPRPEFNDPQPINLGDRPTSIDLSLLEGVHPEDLLTMLRDWKSQVSE